MALDTTSPPDTSAATQFTVDLGQIDLTDEEVNSLQNQITKLAAEFALTKADPAARPKKEPFVKITFVRAIHP
ncbi:MAG TPA: hypothetical protein VN890_06400 [Methylocella sp.]|nr:hypothetical protein [Methylocella sp.]